MLFISQKESSSIIRSLRHFSDLCAISPLCTEETMIEDLFDLIGGRTAIEAAMERFYDRVLHDHNLRQFF
jgi:hypothetical protein